MKELTVALLMWISSNTLLVYDGAHVPEVVGLPQDKSVHVPYQGEGASDEQAELIASFFNVLKDYGDIWVELSFTDRLDLERELTQSLEQLDSEDLCVCVGERRVAIRFPEIEGRMSQEEGITSFPKGTSYFAPRNLSSLIRGVRLHNL